MVIKRNISKRNYVLAFVFTIMIFVIAFLVGMFTDRVFLDDVDQFNDETRFNLFRLELRNKLIENDFCGYEFESSVIEEFDEVTNEIIHLENRL